MAERIVVVGLGADHLPGSRPGGDLGRADRRAIGPESARRARPIDFPSATSPAWWTTSDRARPHVDAGSRSPARPLDPPGLRRGAGGAGRLRAGPERRGGLRPSPRRAGDRLGVRRDGFPPRRGGEDGHAQEPLGQPVFDPRRPDQHDRRSGRRAPRAVRAERRPGQRLRDRRPCPGDGGHDAPRRRCRPGPLRRRRERLHAADHQRLRHDEGPVLPRRGDRCWEDPGQASRPFSVDRAGFVMAEGLRHAPAGHRIRRSTAGPAAPGRAARLGPEHRRPPRRDARRRPDRSLHRSRPEAFQDRVPSRSITTMRTGPARRSTTRSRPPRSRRSSAIMPARMPVSSIKGALGHALGAAPAIEAAVCVRALAEQMVPPTINYRPDPELALDYVPGEGRPADWSRPQRVVRLRGHELRSGLQEVDRWLTPDCGPSDRDRPPRRPDRARDRGQRRQPAGRGSPDRLARPLRRLRRGGGLRSA